MKSLIVYAATCALLATASPVASIAAPSAGGGIVSNGIYKTFYSAGVYVEPSELKEASIPGLTDLNRLILSVPFIDSLTKQFLLDQMQPKSNRKYYNVVQSRFDNETYKRLLQAYSNVTGQPVANLTLFAVTETTSNTTYLLPSFYKLNKTEQMAILFHEGVWVAQPQASYEQVIDVEIKVQRWIENQSSSAAVMNFAKAIDWLVYPQGGNPAADGAGKRLQLRAALQLDLGSNSMAGWAKKGSVVDSYNKKREAMYVTSQDFLGADFLACYQGNASFYDCEEMFVPTHFQNLRYQFPNSEFIRILSELANEKRWGYSFPYNYMNRYYDSRFKSYRRTNDYEPKASYFAVETPTKSKYCEGYFQSACRSSESLGYSVWRRKFILEITTFADQPHLDAIYLEGNPVGKVAPSAANISIRIQQIDKK